MGLKDFFSRKKEEPKKDEVVQEEVKHEELKKEETVEVKEEAVKDGFDIMIVRELTGGLYFGERSTRVENSKRIATDTLNYSEDEIRRVAIKAFELAAKRKGKLTSVDKANVLDSSRLWRSVVEEVARDYSEVKLNHMLVDNCAMQLIVNPSEFDVILTENMFGDILSDEAYQTEWIDWCKRSFESMNGMDI